MFLKKWSSTAHIKRKVTWKVRIRFSEASKKNIELFIYGALVGAIAGTVGSLFRLVLSFIEKHRDQFYESIRDQNWTGWLIAMAIASVSVFIALYLVKKFAPEASGSGVQEIEGALDGVRPLRWKRVLPIKFIGALFSLGSGLLLGREGPTIQLGANLGKMIKDVFHRPDREMNTLVSAGAGAGLASAFNAPLAGIIFVIEEMHGHFKYTFFSVASIMVASALADWIVRAMIGPSPVIKMIVFNQIPLNILWTFIILGFLFSFIGYAFNYLILWSLDQFDKLRSHSLVLTAILVGSVIAAVGIVSSKLIGGGYATISMVLNKPFGIGFLFFLFVTRFILTIFSYSSGVPGGIFAPLVSLGVLFGMFYGHIIKAYFPGMNINPIIFAVAGMAGMFASTVRAPITGLVLAVEMTSNYEMILPLILTNVTAAVTTAILGNKPIYTSLLERTLNKDKKNKKLGQKLQDSKESVKSIISSLKLRTKSKSSDDKKTDPTNKTSKKSTVDNTDSSKNNKTDNQNIDQSQPD